MTIATVRRLAADIMNVGENKIKIAPDGCQGGRRRAHEERCRGLIDKGIITKHKPQGRASTTRVGAHGHGQQARHSDQPTRTPGCRRSAPRGRSTTHAGRDGALKQGTKRAVYSKIKSGMLRSKRALLIYLKEANLVVPKDLSSRSAEFKKRPRNPKDRRRRRSPQSARTSSPQGRRRPREQRPRQRPSRSAHSSRGAERKKVNENDESHRSEFQGPFQEKARRQDQLRQEAGARQERQDPHGGPQEQRRASLVQFVDFDPKGRQDHPHRQRLAPRERATNGPPRGTSGQPIWPDSWRASWRRRKA